MTGTETRAAKAAIANLFLISLSFVTLPKRAQGLTGCPDWLRDPPPLIHVIGDAHHVAFARVVQRY